MTTTPDPPVWASSTVNAIGPLAVSCGVDWSPMSLMVGAVFGPGGAGNISSPTPYRSSVPTAPRSTKAFVSR